MSRSWSGAGFNVRRDSAAIVGADGGSRSATRAHSPWLNACNSNNIIPTVGFNLHTPCGAHLMSSSPRTKLTAHGPLVCNKSVNIKTPCPGYVQTHVIKENSELLYPKIWIYCSYNVLIYYFAHVIYVIINEISTPRWSSLIELADGLMQIPSIRPNEIETPIYLI